MSEKEFNIEEYTPGKSMYIKASAGTGKTYTIQQLVAKLLAGDESKGIEKLNLDQILIVTFTEKATGELRDRIRLKIHEVIEARKINDKACELTESQLLHFEEQYRKVDDAPIYTIHGFCQHTLEELSFTADLPFRLDLIDHSECEEFIGKWFRDVLVNDADFKHLYEGCENKDQLLNSLPHKLSLMIKKMYYDINGNINPEIINLSDDCLEIDGNIISVQDCIDVYKNPGVKVFDKIINGYEKNYQKLASLSSKRAVGLKNAIDEYIQAGRWREVYSGNKIRTNTYEALAASEPDTYEAYCFFTELKERKLELPKPEDLELNLFCFSKLQEIYSLWQKEKMERKVQTFEDMIRNVNEAVSSKSSRLKEELKKQYKCAIIDEFQDTNYKQWNIFKSIFTEDKDHSIIVVGDPKQSIYSFQETDLTVYNNALKELEKNGADCCTLLTNYRSSDSLVYACNNYFSSHFFRPNNCEFTPSKSSSRIDDAQFEGNIITPVIFNCPESNEAYEFDQAAARYIIDCCSQSEINSEWTKLRIHRKGKEGLHNVNFSDFAVIAYTSYELQTMEKVLTSLGIPCSRYNDKGLFSGRECKAWIALFNAIAAPDFSGNNRKHLSELLFSDFFLYTLEDVKLSALDDPSCSERQIIHEWQTLASQRNWAKLQEEIFKRSGMEKRFSTFIKLQSLSKYRQIGDYAINYLYRNNCSIQELVTHLYSLSVNEESAEENGNIIAKGTDFNCVQMITMHSSKGLDYPIVICAGGIHESYNAGEVDVYHKNNKTYLAVYDYGRSLCTKEKYLEYERLFYVAYTRAQSVMFLPFYNSWENNGLYFFLNESTKIFFQQHPDCYSIVEKDDRTKAELQQQVRIILRSVKQQEEQGSKEDQLKAVQELSKIIPELKTRKHSYSSLDDGAAGLKDTVTTDYETRDPEEDEENTPSFTGFDSNSKQIDCPYNPSDLTEIESSYMKGKSLGLAVHKVFELYDFEQAAGLENESSAVSNQDLENLIRESFLGEMINIPEEDPAKIISQTAKIVWNTLNANLPEIIGSNATGNAFNLKEISVANKLSEIGFINNFEGKEWMKNYINGIIDLLFVREVNGKKIYSIVDWKTNSLDQESYANKEKLKTAVDKLFSIQRVLYAYHLVKWLAQFDSRSEEEVFNENFGGIYYVLVRGCKANSGNGIYAQTWNSWKDLNEAFLNICTTLID